MLPQNKISGTNIAWGRGKWSRFEDGTSGYTFPEDDALKIRVNPQTMEEWGVSEDDLYDCIAQIESEFGSPKNQKLSFGMLPNQGYLPIGLTVKSRMNDRVTCVFTPTSLEDKSYDGYFEWYYDELMGYDDLNSFLFRFDKSTASRSSKTMLSPVMPTYVEACEKTQGVLDEGEREEFLKNVWAFHKTPSNGYKRELESIVMPKWKTILEQAEELSVEAELLSYKKSLTRLPVAKLEKVVQGLTDLLMGMPPAEDEENADYNLKRKITQDQLDLAQDELYKRTDDTTLDLPMR